MIGLARFEPLVGLPLHGERDLTFQDVAGLGTEMSAPPAGHVRNKLNQSNHGLVMGSRHIKGLEWRSLAGLRHGESSQTDCDHCGEERCRLAHWWARRGCYCSSDHQEIALPSLNEIRCRGEVNV